VESFIVWFILTVELQADSDFWFGWSLFRIPDVCPCVFRDLKSRGSPADRERESVDTTPQIMKQGSPRIYQERSGPAAKTDWWEADWFLTWLKLASG
jgi:hypothetical protein